MAKFCPNCGCENTEENKFCVLCGKQLPIIHRMDPPSETSEDNEKTVINDEAQQPNVVYQPQTANRPSTNQDDKKLVINELGQMYMESFCSWTKFFTGFMIVILIIFGGLSIIGSINAMNKARILRHQFGGESVAAMSSGLTVSLIIFISLTCLMIYIFSRHYAACNRFQEARILKDENKVTEAFSNLKSASICLGIMMIIYLILIVLALVGGCAVAAHSPISHW